MDVREIVLENGEKFAVPRCIQRIDGTSTHGWQVRYQGTKMFSDHTQDGSGPRQALEMAVRELLKRIATLPAPVTLQHSPSANKTSDLPPGISGPIIRPGRRSKTRTAAFSVLLPQFGKIPRCATVYIGSESTYTAQRYDDALSKALALRSRAEVKYRAAATRARRKEALQIRAVLGKATTNNDA